FHLGNLRRVVVIPLIGLQTVITWKTHTRIILENPSPLSMGIKKTPGSKKLTPGVFNSLKTSAINAASGVAARQVRMLTCFSTVVLVILTYAKIWSLCRISRSIKSIG
ncbi:MAG: hypothetical protein CMJ79_08125, partial [Planctomycetaceae bacterium]|nr:hypothetical protein [Planctomycetaceae bacterium]